MSTFNLLSGVQRLTLIIVTGAWVAWVWASVLVSSADLSWALQCSKLGKGIIDERGKRLGVLAVKIKHAQGLTPKYSAFCSLS